MAKIVLVPARDLQVGDLVTAHPDSPAAKQGNLTSRPVTDVSAYQHAWQGEMVEYKTGHVSPTSPLGFTGWSGTANVLASDLVPVWV